MLLIQAACTLPVFALLHCTQRPVTHHIIHMLLHILPIILCTQGGAGRVSNGNWGGGGGGGRIAITSNNSGAAALR
jgi:hypothetical protein